MLYRYRFSALPFKSTEKPEPTIISTTLNRSQNNKEKLEPELINFGSATLLDKVPVHTYINKAGKKFHCYKIPYLGVLEQHSTYHFAPQKTLLT